MIVLTIPFVTPLYSPLKIRGDEGELFVEKFSVKKTLAWHVFVKDLSLAKVDQPMDDQV